MIEFHDMARTLVRTARTCQGLATREATILGSRAQISPMGSDADIARRLVAVREHFKLSQVDFAGEIHVAKNTLNGYETGKRSLTLETAKRIHERFGVSVDWLLFGDIGQPSHDLIVKLGPKPRILSDAKKPVKSKRAS